MRKLEEFKVERVFEIPGWVRLAILIRTALIILGYNACGHDAGAMLKEISILILLIAPYVVSGIVIGFNEKMGMKCLLIASGFELLLDMSMLIFGLTSFSMSIATGLFNTPFSSGIFLYIGTNWRNVLVEETLKKQGTNDHLKWYQYKREFLVTLAVIIFSFVAYQYISEMEKLFIQYFGYPIFWIELKLAAIMILIEGLLIRIKHYWKWLSIAAVSLLLIITIKATDPSVAGIILVWILSAFIYGYGATMFATASLVYVIRKNIGR